MTDWTAEDLATLNSAIAEGTKKVKYQDKEVEYRNLDEMMKIRDLMRRELGVVNKSGGSRSIGVFRSDI